MRKYAVIVAANNPEEALARVSSVLRTRRSRPRTTVDYVFMDTLNGGRIEVSHPRYRDVFARKRVGQLWERYKGQIWPEWQLWAELVFEPSPTGKRTMWDVFLDMRSLLMNCGLLRRTRSEDPLIILQGQLRVGELLQKLSLEVVEC
jgi:hypothetical protein